MIRKLLVISAALVAIVMIIVAVGYALPQGHVAERSATVAASVERVFTTISDVGSYPTWRTDITKVEVLRQHPLKWREYSGSDAITFEVVESHRPQLLRARIADPELPFGGTWTYALEPNGSGTRLTITEHGEVYNPIFRFMSRFVFGHTATIDKYLQALAAHLSTPRLE